MRAAARGNRLHGLRFGAAGRADAVDGGSTTVTATVTEAGGTPVHDGTVVTFSTTLGAVHPGEAPTARGRTSATFTAGTESGIAEVMAYSGGAVSETVQITSAGVLHNRVVTTGRAGEARTVLATTTPAEVTASVGEISASASVLIEPPTSISIEVAPARPTVGQAVSFEVTLGNEARAIRDARIDFGDGHAVDLGAFARTSVAHTYGTEGAYTVTVTVTDVGGYATASSVVVQVDPPPRVPISITLRPTSPMVGQAVTFTVEVSPPDNAPAVRDVTVDFGDRNSTSIGALSGQGSVVHVYEQDGGYTVRATAVDVAGRRHVTSIALQVRPAPGIQVAVTASPSAPVEDQPVTFTVDVSPGAGSRRDHRFRRPELDIARGAVRTRVGRARVPERR